MNKAHMLDAVLQIKRGQQHPAGMLGVMLEDEIAAGNRPVYVGATEPFPVPAGEWNGAVISLTPDRKCRIVLVDAKRPGRGAFSRLVGAIRAAGYMPAVIEPVGNDMPAIMRKWGWKGRRIGSGWESYAEFTP